MSVSRDRARHPNPEPDTSTTQIRRLASYSDLGESHLGGEDLAHSDVTGKDAPVMRPSFLPAAQDRLPAHAAGSTGAARLARALQRRQVVFLLSSFGLVFGLALVATALVLGLVSSLFARHTPGPPVASGPPIATSLPMASAPTTFARYVTLDTGTRGNWQNVYGSAGYLIVGDTQQLPASIHVTPAGARFWEWAKSTTEARALVRPENPRSRIAACWFSASTFTLDVNITDGQTYQLALYVLGWDRQHPRLETVSVVDPSSGRVLDTRRLRVFGIGDYLVWQVRGHVTIQVTNNGSINAVASGLFFTPAASASA